MPTFDAVAALVAGLTATVALTVLMQASSAMGMMKMPAMVLIQGSMFTGDQARAKQIGMATHVIMMGTANDDSCAIIDGTRMSV
ncbi:MAG: hypothetical protein WD360_07990 [Nitriliruptoraceae bacterium]